MNIEVEKLSETAVKLSISVPFTELEADIQKAYVRIAKSVNIPGFRKGKVPTSIIDQRFGRAAVLEEALNQAVPAAYEKAVIEKGLKPIAQPRIDVTELKDGDRVDFVAEVDVRPEFDLPAYDSLKIEVDAVELSEEKIAEQIDALRGRFATLNAVDRVCQDGDLLLIDIAGDLEGEAIADLNANALSYELGTDGMLPGFDEAVRGAAKDETRVFDFVPEAGEHASKTIKVTVNVKAVRERILPELNDDFAQLASEFDTVAELKADVEQRLGRLSRLEQGYQARDKVQAAILEAVDIPLPEAALQAEIDDHFKDGHGDEEHKTEYVENARKSMIAQFVFDKIAEVEELQVSEAELSTWLVQQAPRYNMSPQDFADALVKSGGVQMAVADVRRAKAIEVVLKSAQVVDSNGKIVNLEDLDQDLAAFSQ
jgi:trigger factor